MSWAANRNTTREEDIAYCLFGIFDIHMPLQYGEGKKAFRRLQEEILKVTEDYTWLAWTSRSPEHHSVFATSPSCFAKPRDQEDYPQSFLTNTTFAGRSLQSQLPWVKQQPRSIISWNFSQLKPVNSINLSLTESCVRSLRIEEKRLALDEFPRLTPRGLRLTLPILKDTSHGLVAFLHCICEPAGQLVCLALSKESSDSGDKYYKRADEGVVLLSDKEVSMQYKTIYLKTTATFNDSLRDTAKRMENRRIELKQTIILSTGLEKSPVLLFHEVGWNPDIAYHFVLRYESVHFHLLFGLQRGSWCYLALDQDHTFLPGQTDSLKNFIAESIVGQESDRTEVGVKGIMIYCTIKERNRDWMRFQASRYDPEHFKEVEGSLILHYVDIWALPDALEQLEIVQQEQIEGVSRL
jgi:hypothetical protein